MAATIAFAACPWNKFAQAATELRYHGPMAARHWPKSPALDDAAFRERFSGSPIKRRRPRPCMVRNVLYAIGNSGLPRSAPGGRGADERPRPDRCRCRPLACERLP